MTELVNDSTDRSHDAAAYAANLMRHYGFDLDGEAIAQLLLVWQQQYPAAWIRLATIEALYQGRYKAVSVEQILALWQRRSQPIYHFTHEFERLICDRLPQPLTPPASLIQEEPFSMRSAQAMVAQLPYHTAAIRHSNLEVKSLNSDAMEALRTLHDATVAPSFAANVAAESSAAPSEPPLSYTLQADTARSPEPPSRESIDAHEAISLPNHANSNVPSVLLPLDPAVNDATLQTRALASTDPRSDSEPIHATNPPADASLPTSDSQQTPASKPQAASIARILQQLDDQEIGAKVLFPGLGLLDQTLEPKLRLQLTARYQPIWITDTSSKEPIHQFLPTPETSDFHTKLKSVAQVSEAMPEDESCDPPLQE